MLREGSIFHTYMLTKLICQSPIGEIYQAIDVSSGARLIVKIGKDDWEQVSASDMNMQGYEFVPGRFRSWTPRPAELMVRSAGIASDAAFRGLSVPQLDSDGDFHGIRYASYKFIEGQTLEQLLESGSLVDLLSIASLVIEVSKIQERGRFHGNLQPSGILVAAHQVLLLEPTVLEAAFDNSHSQDVLRCITSADYYPTLDPRDDQLAIGIILYRVFTGVHPLKTTPSAGNGRPVRRVDPKLIDWLNKAKERGAGRYLTPLLNYHNPSQVSSAIATQTEELISKAMGIRRVAPGTADECLEIEKESWLDLQLNPDTCDRANIWTLNRISAALADLSSPTESAHTSEQ